MSEQLYSKKMRNAVQEAAAPAASVSESKNITAGEMLHASNAGAPQPMSPELREKFEPAFGADFSNIRISRGRIPDKMGVEAVAKGTDILVDSRAGMDVLGHELAHVVQQAQGRVQGGRPVVNDAGLEHEADVQGARAASGFSAMGGGMGGFGGEMTSIAPMSSASAPAQCKSKTEKELEKAKKSYDSGMKTESSSEKSDARKKYGAKMRSIVGNMSDEELHSPKMQKYFTDMASSAANKGLKAQGKDGDWEKYATVLRGGEIEEHQAGMNEMMIRLMGGRENIRGTLKGGGSDEQTLTDTTSLMEGNDEVMAMLGNFSQDAFKGVDAANLGSDQQRDMAVMNNLITRIISGSAAPRAGEEIDRDALKAAQSVQVLAKAKPATGELMPTKSGQMSPAGQSFASLPARARARIAPAQPAAQQPVAQPQPTPTISPQPGQQYVRPQDLPQSGPGWEHTGSKKVYKRMGLYDNPELDTPTEDLMPSLRPELAQPAAPAKKKRSWWPFGRG